jgi:hypothetical protein
VAHKVSTFSCPRPVGQTSDAASVIPNISWLEGSCASVQDNLLKRAMNASANINTLGFLPAPLRTSTPCLRFSKNRQARHLYLTLPTSLISSRWDTSLGTIETFPPKKEKETSALDGHPSVLPFTRLPHEIPKLALSPYKTQDFSLFLWSA